MKVRCTSYDASLPEVQGCQVGQASQRVATVAKHHLAEAPGSQTPQGSQGRHEGALDFNIADVQGLQAGAVAQLLESCKKTQQKAVAIHPKALVVWRSEASSFPSARPSMCQHPDCAFLASTGATEEREERSKKGPPESDLEPRIPTPTAGSHPDSCKECNHARRRPQRLHLSIQHGTQPTFVI